MSKLSQERSSRRVVEAEDIAKLDFGVSVVAIVVLGEHHGEGPEEGAEPSGRPPSDLAGVAPPDVKLTEREPRHGSGPREAPEEPGNDEIGHGAEEAVEQHRGIGREHRVVEVGAPLVVMRSQVQREPKMLWDVIEER